MRLLGGSCPASAVAFACPGTPPSPGKPGCLAALPLRTAGTLTVARRFAGHPRCSTQETLQGLRLDLSNCCHVDDSSLCALVWTGGAQDSKQSRSRQAGEGRDEGGGQEDQGGLPLGCLHLSELHLSGCSSVSPLALTALAVHGCLDRLSVLDLSHLESQRCATSGAAAPCRGVCVRIR